MSVPSSAQFAENDNTQAPIILLNGLPVKTTYMANCRLCLGTNFGERSTTIIEAQFDVMLKHVFSFPITNKIGLPMNVCSKCRKGVELFFRYTQKVQMNQKKLEETFISMDYEQPSGNVGGAAQEKSQHPATSREQEISYVIEIVSDDEFQKTNDDTLIGVDMQCEPVTDNLENDHDPFLPRSSYDYTQTHFVAVPCPTEALRCAGSDSFRKRGTKPIAAEPVVIDIISLSDDECEESAAMSSRQRERNGKRTKKATDNQSPLPKPQSSERTSSQAKPTATALNNVNYLGEALGNLTGGVTLVYYEADANEVMNEASTSSSKHSVSSTIKEPNAKRQTTRTHKNVR